eukprot:jgi/Astpho2/1293/Aster-x0993
MSNIVPKHREPSRGVLAGVKSDRAVQQAAKLTGGEPTRDARGVGAAWSHNFLNQKPWHPANFRNQAKVFEAEQAAIKAAKDKEIAKQEFEAEQDYIKTLSYLTEADRQKHQERQSVSWMYQKPPGVDAIKPSSTQESAPGDLLSRRKNLKACCGTPVHYPLMREALVCHPQDAAGAGPSNANQQAGAAPQLEGPGAERQQRQRQPPPKGHLANMLGAMVALKEQEKWEVKHVSGMGNRSPPRGLQVNAASQQFLVDDDEEDAGAAAAVPALPEPDAKRVAKRRKPSTMQDKAAVADTQGRASDSLTKSTQSQAKRPGRSVQCFDMAPPGHQLRLSGALQLQEAEALLRAAGLDPAQVAALAVAPKSNTQKHKHSKKKGEKHKKKSRKRRRRDSSAGQSSGGSE